MATTAKKVNKHPRLYTIFQPNELIKAKKFEMAFIEKRVYYHILNYNHTKTPDQLVYEIAYEDILNPNDAITGNRKSNAKRIANALQKRMFLFDSSFMKREFGEDAETAMTPFPEINCYDDHFKVQLWPRFKKILCLIGLGFTKGDLDTLKSFQHEISDNMYWLIRQRQVFMNTWKVELADLKELLDLSGRYEAWDNFKRKALDKAKADCKGTWSEFDYKAVKKGKGGGVHSIIFYFKNGPKEEKDIPPGEDYAWEESLLRHGVEPIKIKEIRQRVKINQEGRNEDKNITFYWDSDYVRFSLEALGNELKEKKKDKKKKQVQNLGGFVYTGLMSGYWIDYVNSRKEKIKNEVQQNLDFVNGSARPEPIAKIENKMNGSSSIHVLQEQELLEWQELHLVSPQKDKPFEEFMNKNNYYMVDGAWVR